MGKWTGFVQHADPSLLSNKNKNNNNNGNESFERIYDVFELVVSRLHIRVKG